MNWASKGIGSMPQIPVSIIFKLGWLTGQEEQGTAFEQLLLMTLSNIL